MMQKSLKITLIRNSTRLQILFFVVFLPLAALSQQKPINYPIIELKGLDTIISFQLDQGKKLAQFNEERKKLIVVTGIQEKQIAQKDSIISHQSVIIDSYKSIETAQQIIVMEKSKQIGLCDEQNKIINNELKRQKRYKWTAIISGITSVVLVQYLNMQFN